MKPSLPGKIALTVALLSVATVVITVGVLAAPALRSRLGFAAAPQTQYVAGEIMDLPSSLYATASFTLVYFGSSKCGACQSSKTETQRVVGEFSRRLGDQAIMVTGNAFIEEELEFGRQLGFDDSRIVRVNLKELRVKRVPTFVLVDGRGQVVASHEGILEPSDRDNMLRKRDSIAAAK